MKSVFALLSCATVLAFGLGIKAHQPDARQLPAHLFTAAPSIALDMLEASPVHPAAFVQATAPRTVASRATHLPVLPTVYVTASTSSTDALEASVMLEAAVGEARDAVTGGAARSARRIGLAVPYFAFAKTGGTE